MRSGIQSDRLTVGIACKSICGKAKLTNGLMGGQCCGQSLISLIRMSVNTRGIEFSRQSLVGLIGLCANVTGMLTRHHGHPSPWPYQLIEKLSGESVKFSL